MQGRGSSALTEASIAVAMDNLGLSRVHPIPWLAAMMSDLLLVFFGSLRVEPIAHFNSA